MFDSGAGISGFNRYMYAGGNPMMFADPSGHFIVFAIAIGALIGAIIGGTNGDIFNANAWINFDVDGAIQGAIIGALASTVSIMTATIAASAGISSVTAGIIGQAAGGFVNGFITTSANGGDLNESLLGGLLGGTIGAAFALGAVPLNNTLGGQYFDTTAVSHYNGSIWEPSFGRLINMSLSQVIIQSSDLFYPPVLNFNNMDILVTSRYGYRPGYSNPHSGLDIKSFLGSSVYSIESGIVTNIGVIQKGNSAGTTFVEILSTRTGLYIGYWHTSGGNIKLNQYITAGQPIGNTDISGRSTGPHLHLTISYTPIGQSRWRINPELYLNEYLPWLRRTYK